MDLGPRDPGQRLSPRQEVLLRHAELVKLRDPRMADWRDLNDYILPRRLRYLYTDKRKSTRNSKIINGTATRAVRILESGMMAGMTNPSRPWLRMITDKSLMRISRVNRWLGEAGPKALQAFSRSNIYKCLPKYYGDMAVFGTATLYLEPDPRDVLRGYVLPLGQYAAANDPFGRVNTLSREFTMTVANVVRRFPWEKISERVKSAYRAQRYDEDVVLVHMVDQRMNRDPERQDNRNMPYRSVWLEKDGGDDIGFLREGGFKRFPYLVSRWEVTDDADDVYGDGPGIDAIGDGIALQLLERRKSQAVDKIVTPPMAGPSGLRATNMSLVPGGYTGVDVNQGGQQFRPSVDINPAAPKSISELIREHEIRLKETFMADLWLMMASSDRREITAREVDERHEEKMIQLGPVVDRLNDELIDPLVEFTIEQLIIRGELPPPPPELYEADVKVDNISIMGQAQKLIGTVGLERLAGFAGNLAAVDKGILDNIDRDRLVRNYADMLGVSPDNLSDEEKMALDRQARAEQEASMAAAESMAPIKQGADAAKVLSETDVNGASALERLMTSVGAGQ